MKQSFLPILERVDRPAIFISHCVFRKSQDRYEWHNRLPTAANRKKGHSKKYSFRSTQKLTVHGRTSKPEFQRKKDLRADCERTLPHHLAKYDVTEK